MLVYFTHGGFTEIVYVQNYSCTSPSNSMIWWKWVYLILNWNGSLVKYLRGTDCSATPHPVCVSKITSPIQIATNSSCTGRRNVSILQQSFSFIAKRRSSPFDWVLQKRVLTSQHKTRGGDSIHSNVYYAPWSTGNLNEPFPLFWHWHSKLDRYMWQYLYRSV